MQRIEVPGGWVDFREPEDVPERLRRRVTVLASSAPKVASKFDAGADVEMSDMEFLLAFNDAIAMCLITGWSFTDLNGQALPVSEDNLQELPGRVYDTIVNHCQSMTARLLPNFGVDIDPKAPTGS